MYGCSALQIYSLLQELDNVAIVEKVLLVNAVELFLKLPFRLSSCSNNVLKITDGVDNMGTMVWPLFGALAFSWILTYFSIWKGVKVTGKIMYFTGKCLSIYTQSWIEIYVIFESLENHRQPLRNILKSLFLFTYSNHLYTSLQNLF